MKFYTDNQEEAIIVSKKLFSDLLDMAVFRAEELRKANHAARGVAFDEIWRQRIVNNVVIQQASAVWEAQDR